MDIRGEYGFSSLVKQNKKAEIYAVFCFVYEAYNNEEGEELVKNKK